MNIFSAHLQRKSVVHFPSVQKVLSDNVSASVAFDKAVEKHCQLINRLMKEFENRFCDFEQIEPCVSFISNPFTSVDITGTAENLSTTFTLDAGQVEMEIITLQNIPVEYIYNYNCWCVIYKRGYVYYIKIWQTSLHAFTEEMQVMPFLTFIWGK